MKIKKVLIKGRVAVTGIYNYDHAGKRDGNNNHKFAKKDNNGIDFTSSRCLRHEIYKNDVPNQPCNADFKTFFVRFAASEVGIMRGYLYADSGFKRYSPLHVADAYTHQDDQGSPIDRSVIFFDQGSSSKPKEKTEEKNRKGEDRADTSMFSQDNAPVRYQRFVGGINLKELQFLPLQKGYYQMVADQDEKDFIASLEQTFRLLGCKKPEVHIGEYEDIGAIYKTSRRGILLSQEQQLVLVQSTVQRILSIDGIKSGAAVVADRPSFHVELFGQHGSPLEIKADEIAAHLNNHEFNEFFKAR
jgi:hypothetical protein